MRLGTALLGASIFLGSTIWGSDVQACGGLFCSASNPVNQAAERIIFSDNGDGTITAVIEIQYASREMRREAAA